MNLPIYFKIYQDGAPLTDEQALDLPEFGLDYMGVNLSACAGSDDMIYLVCRLITEEFPLGHIFLLTLNIETGSIIGLDDLTPEETRPCLYPYVAVMPAIGGRDVVYATFELHIQEVLGIEFKLEMDEEVELPLIEAKAT